MSIFSKSLLRMVLIFLLSLLVLSAVVFFVASYAPGDPLQSFYGDRLDHMTPEQLAAARDSLGLNGTVYEQYISWLEKIFQGDMGFSLKYREPVSQVIFHFMGNTIFLGVISYFFIFFIAIAAAVCCVLYENTWVDRILAETGTILYYLPTFWVGLILILIFNVNLGWLPGSGAYYPGESGNLAGRIEHVILPVIVMMTSHVWYYAYMVRNKLLDETRKEYVLLAKMKGLSRLHIILTHCLRNVAPTIFSIMAIGVNHVIGGAYVVEAVFSYPGIGKLAVDSAKYHDYNLLMIIVLMTGAVVIGSGLIAHVLSEYVDRRMKVEEGGQIWENHQTSC